MAFSLSEAAAVAFASVRPLIRVALISGYFSHLFSKEATPSSLAHFSHCESD